MSVVGTRLHHDLNNMSPAAASAKLGDCIYDLINAWNGFLAHVDTANVTGIGNANAATYGVKLPEQRSGKPEA